METCPGLSKLALRSVISNSLLKVGQVSKKTTKKNLRKNTGDNR